MSSSPEVIGAVENGKHGLRRRRWAIVGLAVITGLTVAFVLFLRAHRSEQSDDALCRKIDRFILAVEIQTASSSVLPTTEKSSRIDFYERFRHDAPVCLTGPRPAIAKP